MDLIKRSHKMIDELGISITAFCRNIGISTAYFYYVNPERRYFFFDSIYLPIFQ